MQTTDASHVQSESIYLKFSNLAMEGAAEGSGISEENFDTAEWTSSMHGMVHQSSGASGATDKLGQQVRNWRMKKLEAEKTGRAIRSERDSDNI